MQNKKSKGLTLELQAYLKEVAKLRLHLLVQLDRCEEIQTLLEQMVKWFIGNHIDQVYVFLKALRKQLGVLKAKGGAKARGLFRTISLYMLDRVLLREGLLNLAGTEEAQTLNIPDDYPGKQAEPEEEVKAIDTAGPERGGSTWEYSKVVELALEILLKSWKAWGFSKHTSPGALQSIDEWPDHALFRDTTAKVVEAIADKFPANANYKATVIRL